MNPYHVSQTSRSCFPLLDVDDLEIADCSKLLFIRSCHEDVIFTGKSHNFAGTAFVQGDSVGGSKLTEQTLLKCKIFIAMATFSVLTFIN